MITLTNFINAIDYKITGGSDYGWNCFGTTARFLDSDHQSYSANVVFDNTTQLVYISEIHDYVNNRSYRWMHPDYATVYENEALEKHIDNNIAHDDVKFIDLCVADDWIEKCTAIVNNNFDYDTRVTIELDLDEKTMYELMLAAHKKDITFNQLVVEILEQAIAYHSNTK